MSQGDENGSRTCNVSSAPKKAEASQQSLDSRKFLDNIRVVKRSDSFL